MTPEHWNTVSDLFNRALDVPPDQRTALLDEVDPFLRREVEKLLAAYDEDPGYLELPAGRIPDDWPPDAPPLPEKAHVGPYRLLNRIGSGGMGTVYLAVRDDDQYHKEVAVKLIKLGMDTEEILRRFRAERQILASLEHPHIARLLDGGMTSDGRPYVVMEYVDGLPLDVYCNKHRLPIRERLALFRTVCLAVQYAHQNLVVHRDLKPSNILVTADGVPKLLDFGIAKLLDPERLAFTVPVTRTALRLMTPEYASPEQVHGAMVTTASDVYQLGVLLYELLTGHRPYRLHARTTEDIAQAIREVDPERPSAAVQRTVSLPMRDGTTATITPEAVSAARDTEPGRLQRHLAGDLDTIVLKAMHKEPSRRYVSVEALASDLQRYLAGQPVLARPDTLGYRLRKFVRRNRAGVGVAIAFAVLLLGFGLLSAHQARRVAQERDTARAERDKAEQVVQVLVNLFKTSDPTAVPGGDTLRVGAFLERGEAPMLDALADQPDVLARMKQVLASIYSARSQYERAHTLLEDALAQQETLTGLDDPAALSMYHDLALVARALGDPEAEALLRTSLVRQRERYGPRHEKVAAALHDLASVLSDWEERERLLQEALAIRREVLPPVSSGVAASLNGLAVLHYSHNDIERAIRLWQEALTILRQLHEEGHPHVLTVTQNLAAAQGRSGRFDEAEHLLKEVLDQRRRVLGAETVPVGVTLSNLGVMQASQGRYAEAEDVFRDAVATWRAIFTQDHWRTANDLRNLGIVLQRLQRHDEAYAALAEAIAINRRLYGAESRQVGYVRGQLGILLLHRGQPEAARREVEAALRLVGAEVEEGRHSALADTQIRMGQVLLAVGAAEDAEQLFRQALSYRSSTLPPSDPQVHEVQCGLAVALADQGAVEEAAMHLRQALPGYAAWGRADPWLLARARTALSTASSAVREVLEEDAL